MQKEKKGNKTFDFCMHVNFLSRYLFKWNKTAESKDVIVKLSDENIA